MCGGGDGGGELRGFHGKARDDVDDGAASYQTPLLCACVYADGGVLGNIDLRWRRDVVEYVCLFL